MPNWMWPFLVAFFTFALAGLASIVGFSYTIYVKFSERITKLEAGLAQAKTELLPLSALVQAQLLEIVHHNEERFRECDDLIDKFKMLTIKRPEGTDRLDALLAERETDITVSEKERQQAIALRAFMKIVVIETQEKQDAIAKITNTGISILFWAITAMTHTVRYFKFQM